MNKRPIGMLDSGVGGLTVYKEVRKKFPNEDIIYFGDTKSFPYGNKSKESIIELARAGVEFLISKNVKLIVIACGTATSQALDTLKNEYDILYSSLIPLFLICSSSAFKFPLIGLLVSDINSTFLLLFGCRKSNTLYIHLKVFFANLISFFFNLSLVGIFSATINIDFIWTVKKSSLNFFTKKFNVYA